MRASIAAIRSGRPPASAAGTPKVRAGADIAERLRAWSAHGTGAADPYGWRALSRTIGDGVVGGGFGVLFERQIQQESGFAPEIVFGQRRSSAGAEGIAQLMPQYYPHVNRTDPAQSLRAGAQTMQQHLQTFGGDVRKALAPQGLEIVAITGEEMREQIRRDSDRWAKIIKATGFRATTE
mgnify:CR=1 FL=1